MTKVRHLLVLACVGAFLFSCGGSATESGSEGTISDPLRFIRVGSDQRTFRSPGGSVFIPVGHNDWTDLRLMSDAQRLERYLSHMKNYGENVLRITLDSNGNPDDSPYQNQVELRVGEFNPDVILAMDNLVETAERNGIYLFVALWCVYEKVNWSSHAYNIQHDPEKGLVESPDELLRDRAAIGAAKERMRFFIERWGSSPSIFAWELWNEVNVVGTTEQRNLWIEEIGRYAKQMEIELYGEHHLRTASTNNAGVGSSEEGIFTSPELDFTSYHTYDAWGRVGVNPFSGVPQASSLDPILYFVFLGQSARLAMEKSGSRPVLGTEDLAIVTDPRKVPWPFNAPFRNYTQEQLVDFFIGSAWVSWMGGGAGPSLRWPCSPIYGEDKPEGYRALSNEMYEGQRALRRILSTVDWTAFEPAPAPERIEASDPEQFISLDLSDGKTVLGCVLNGEKSFVREETRVDVTFRSLANKPYQIDWYDMRTGDLIQTDRDQGPTFTILSPSFKTFVAVKASIR